MPQKNELIAYAIDFTSYLVSNFEDINNIFLYGSIPRGDFDDESDIDLFIDADEKLNKKVQKKIEDYYKTRSFKEWELKGVNNGISCIVGKLDSEEWKNLKRSIINTGIVLYGKYKSNVEKVNQYALFSFENIKPDKKRVLVFRKLFGFKRKDKLYPGLTEKTNSLRLGKGIILVPSENSEKIISFLKEKKVAYKIYDFWSDVKIG